MAIIPENLLAHFVDRGDFCHPEWREISKKLQAEPWPHDHLPVLWRELVLNWLTRLREALGQDYKIYETKNFFLLANPVDKSPADYLAFLEKARTTFREVLLDASWTGFNGKHVALLFDRDADYCRYVAPLYTEGDPVPLGMFTSMGGYAHMVLPYVKGSVLRGLAYLYAHNSLCHLPLPRWLRAGLSKRFEGLVVSAPRFNLDVERCDRHYACWNEITIQEFWSGKSWESLDEPGCLSFELSRILFGKIEQIIRPTKENMRLFIKEAHHRDAGDKAARQYLGWSLGDLVADFLGEGNWAPQPDVWKAAETTMKSD